jgi:hypothetical protein
MANGEPQSFYDAHFKNVEPVAFVTKPEAVLPSFDELVKSIEKNINLSPQELLFLKEGIDTEKNKINSSIRIAFDTLINVLDQETPQTLDKDSLVIYQKNKKTIKELLITCFNLTKQYAYDERRSKIVLMGKVLQSLHDSNK